MKSSSVSECQVGNKHNSNCPDCPACEHNRQFPLRCRFTVGTKFKKFMESEQDFEPTQISLCKSCYCMTHTMNDGSCGKCKAQKTDSGKEWSWLYELDEQELLESRDKIVKYSSSLLHQSREEALEELWTWAINNGITDKKSFVALRDKIKSLKETK